ncbi:MAG: cyclic pyranopterin monophosphate synthase MoaC [Candidatus Methylomirabilia bacterium]
MTQLPKKLSHLDAAGQARMVDISGKPETSREAVAESTVVMNAATWALAAAGEVPKGDVLGAARLAGIMAAKRTPELIPLCHPLQLSQVDVTFEARPAPRGKTSLRILAVARCFGQTGVEMEAMTAAAVAALTVYDMCKAADRWMTIREVRLLEKRGGKSGTLSRLGRRLEP